MSTTLRFAILAFRRLAVYQRVTFPIPFRT